MKTILVALISSIVTFIVAYLLICFLLWEFNVTKWGDLTNPTWTFIRLFIICFVLFIVEIYANK